MKILSYNPTSIQNNSTGTTSTIQFSAKPYQNPQKIGENILRYNKRPKAQMLAAKNDPPGYLAWLGNFFKKNAGKTEKLVNNEKTDIEKLVNIGNISKELVCMIVYPLQVLTNPDLSKDKRRFVGFYDFYVTCFSLAGTVLYAWKGDELMKNAASKMLKKSLKGKNVPRLEKATRGGAFVIGIALQTILFKRVIAPAFAPPLAAKTRKMLNERDAKKEQMNNNSNNKIQTNA